jgi:hypothetical protein
MEKRINVQIGPHLAPAKVKILPARDDELDKAKREITHLRHEISRLETKIRRMAEDLEYEISGWKTALDTGQRQESVEAIKRRISRLTGAILYQGTIDYDKIDNLKER